MGSCSVGVVIGAILMRVGVNDLSFHFSLFEREKAIVAVNQFITICHYLESKRCHKVDRLLSVEINKSQEIYSNATLFQMVQEITDRDERRYFLSLMANRGITAFSADIPAFVFQEYESKICSELNKDFVVSLASLEEFKENSFSGQIDGETVRIKNISDSPHCDFYRNELGLRFYEANSEKHKKDRVNHYGKAKEASPMDLDGEDAQELLDDAIEIKGRLYARRGNKNYTFQSTGDCVYHGYEVDNLQMDVLSVLMRKKWD